MTNKPNLFERLRDVYILTDDEVKQLLRVLWSSVVALERQVEELKEQVRASQSNKH